MSSVAEITYFEASEAYKADPSSLNGPLESLRKTEGLISSYIGYETEDPKILFWVNDWKSKSSHDALVQSEVYPGIVAASRPAFASQPVASYVEFDNTVGPLSAAATEFVTFTLNEGQSVDKLDSLVNQLKQQLVGTPKFHGASWGKVIGKSNVYFGILGWDSVQDHWDAVAGGPLKATIDQVKEIATLWLVHAHLKKVLA
ncbi:hypothetical protein BJ138DRAFT_1103822 [Hygrophoropsis aurantiaca]|uniref:Uncharacterized protein n=1 Tax=Hygrophoropsis aurantiaca TaxID=72124 RepID=A0ACB8A4N1_9AGAM|nr:hypothetical protein BJ138DRAFT_1103822 [Hygrophoropsis aurantiaca]